MIINFKKHFLFFLICFFISVTSFSQQGWWTWMKGTYPGTSIVNWGTQGVPSINNEPPGEYTSATCWVDSQGKLWQFGGGGNGWGTAALWKYDPVTNMWTWVKGPNTNGTANLGVWGTKGVANIANTPPALTLGTVTWVDASDNLWMYGGFAWGTPVGAFRGYMSAVWKYDPLTNMWTWMNGPSPSDQPGVYGVQGVPSPANYPPARIECNAGLVDNSGNLWLFGGQRRTGETNDLWKYNPTTNEWTWMKGPNTAGSAGSYGIKGVAVASNLPPARQVHSRWKDKNGNFWFFGGTHSSNSQFMNDMWKFDPLTNNWTWMSGSNLKDQLPTLPVRCVPSIANSPQARRENNSNWVDRCGNLWMFSGELYDVNPNDNIRDNNDMWCYKVQTNEWVLVHASVVASAGAKGVPAASNMPPSTTGYAAWTRNNEFWLFGGIKEYSNGSTNESNTLWRYIPDSTCAQSICWPPATTNPVASFSGTNLIGCANLTVNFTNTSSNSTGWTWIFGDGSPTSNVQSPSHTYTLPGQYTVTLIATDGTTSDTTISVNYVTVVAPGVAAYTMSDDTICLGQNITFTNNTTNANGYTWFFGDGAKDTITNPSHTYATTGTFTVTLYATNQYGCNDTINSTVVVIGINAIAGSAVTLGCLNATGAVTVNTATPGVTYLWSGPGIVSGGTTDSAIVNAAGTYTVIITDPASGCTNSATVNVTNNTTSPSLTAGNPLVLTCTITSDTINVTSTNSGLTYVWQGPGILSGGATPNPIVNAAGTYSVTVTDPITGCTNTATVTVTGNSTVPTVTPGNPLALSCTITSGPINATSTTSGVSYSWQGPGIVSGATNQNAIVNAVGTYTVTVTNPANGCTATTTVNVTNNSPAPNVLGGAPLTITCRNGTGTINATSTTSGVIYLWSGPGIVSGGTTASPTINAAGTYTVTVTDPLTGCTASSTVVVIATPPPTAGVSPDVTITLGNTTTLTATGGGTYLWSPAFALSTLTGSSTIATPAVTTTYCVEVTDSSGCKDTACVTVSVEKPCAKEENLGVPNAFSPNQDGINDEFCVSGWDDCIQLFKIIIFDRWGEKVYESNDPNFCWDGKYKGKDMDAQVFVYQIKAVFVHQQKVIIKKGNISLIK